MDLLMPIPALAVLRRTDVRAGNLILKALFVLLLAVLTLSQAAAESMPSKEVQIKAVFLFNFAEFVEWPSTAFSDPAAPLRIGVLGEDPFGSVLDDVVKGETVHGRKIVVERNAHLQELKNCQMLYVGRSEKSRVPDILSELGQSPTLLVGDFDGFCRLGGVIQFFLEGNKIRFLINPPAAQKHDLKLSSQLLTVGKLAPPDASGEHN